MSKENTMRGGLMRVEEGHWCRERREIRQRTRGTRVRKAGKGKELLYNVHHARSFWVLSCEDGKDIRSGRKDACGE